MTAATAPSPARPVAVETSALVKEYGRALALDGLDLQVAAGESLLLLGPNGSGKSTLLRILAMLSRPTAGLVRLHGQAPAEADRAALRRRIGLLSHQTFLYDHLTALENLAFYARLYALEDPRGAALSALRVSGIEHRRDDQVRTLSRGIQQRVAIARALLHHPDIVLLDEPFTGLDRAACDRLQETLAGLRDSRRTCIMATHDFSTGLAFASRIVVLSAGRLVLDRESRGLSVAELEDLFRRSTGASPTGVA